MPIPKINIGSRKTKLAITGIATIIFLSIGIMTLQPLFLEPVINVNINVKPQIMSALYKVYGNPDFAGGGMWLARVIFKNMGPVSVYNVKIQYKIEISGLTLYKPEWSEPKTYPIIVPGETVIDLYYPIFPSEILTLTTTAPSKLSVKYEYTTPGGKTYTDTKTYNFDLLARNEIVYTSLSKEEFSGTWYDMFDNYWAIAAWVTPNEKTLRDFVGHYVAGFSPNDDEQALKLWVAAYDAITNYGIQYMFTPSSPWDSKEAYQITQVIKFPKDVIQSKAGTCIELSLLMASIAAAYDLHVYIFLMPGHAIPVVELPQSGKLVPIESTAIGRLSAEDAINAAIKEIRDATNNGPYYLIDIQGWWSAGVIPPE